LVTSYLAFLLFKIYKHKKSLVPITYKLNMVGTFIFNWKIQKIKIYLNIW